MQHLTSEPVLQFYDPRRQSKVSADASKSGLGVVLLQEHNEEWMPLIYASRAMTQVEVKYAQMEKEAPAMVFGFTQFHEYVYGQRVIAEADQADRTCSVMPKGIWRKKLKDTQSSCGVKIV